MLDAEKWLTLKNRLTASEEWRDYEGCALISLELSDECENVDVAQAWVTQAQVYATLAVARQMQVQAERDELMR